MKTAIIGAGFGGMAAAYDLLKAGHSVDILEAAAQPGGLSAGFREPNWDWSLEYFYHHWFHSDRFMLQLFRDLGVQDKVIFRRPYTVVYHEGKFYPFDSIPAALLYPGLGWGVNKVRFGLVGLYLRLARNWRSLERHTVDAWMRRWAGNRVYEEMWEPLMIGKFGERYARQVNMAWMWARLHARTTRLGTYRGGFQAFADEFAAILEWMGARILYKTPVQQVRQTPAGGLELALPGGTATYDRVLATTSPALLARLAPSLQGNYLKNLLELKSMGAVVLILSLSQQLSRQGYYWFSLPKKAGFPFLALVEHTNFTPAEHYGGDHIIYCGDYLETDHEYFRLEQEELARWFLPSLKRINPNFDDSWVRKTWLFRSDYAQPVPLLNHSRNIPGIRTPIPGLFFASMSQVYPWDRGTNYAVEIARRAAALMQQPL